MLETPGLFYVIFEGGNEAKASFQIRAPIESFKHFFTRAAEHMGISNLTGKRLKCVKQSTVSDHLLECNCSIDFGRVDILASDANKFRLLIKESLLIIRDQTKLNKTIKSFPLKLLTETFVDSFRPCKHVAMKF